MAINCFISAESEGDEYDGFFSRVSRSGQISVVHDPVVMLTTIKEYNKKAARKGMRPMYRMCVYEDIGAYRDVLYPDVDYTFWISYGTRFNEKTGKARLVPEYRYASGRHNGTVVSEDEWYVQLTRVLIEMSKIKDRYNEEKEMEYKRREEEEKSSEA